MKKRISIFLILSILIISLHPVTVKADTLTENWTRTFNLAKENVEALYDLAQATLGLKTEKGRKAIESCLSPLGFIVGYITISEQNFVDIFNMKNYGGVTIGGENATPEEVVDDVNDFIINNITFSDNTINFGNAKPLLKDYADYVMSQEPWEYMYSFDIAETVTQWNNGVIYNRVRDIVRDHQNNYYVLYSASSTYANDTTNFYFWFIPKTDDMQFCRYIGAWDSKHIGIASYRSWQWILNENSYRTVSCNVYKFNGDTLELYETRPQSIYNIGLQADPEGSSIGNQNGATNTNPVFVSTVSGKDQVVLWDSLDAMKRGSVGQKGYYVSDSYNTNISDSNNTYDSSNSNNITYGDVTNYINNYYGTNGENPTQPVINIYINNNIPSGGGGSGGGGSGGGGSGGGSDSDLGIFDFLSRIGQVLGNLIKNLGNVLAELVEGISTTIQALFESIPTVFNDFLGGVLGWLPSELRALITLAISAMVIVGLIKMFRS